MTISPALFVSHGSPMMAIEPGEAGAALRRLGRTLPHPAAILVISGHWTTRTPAVSTAGTPETMHDFGGFPRALHQITYPAPGAPVLGSRVHSLLTQAGFDAIADARRGLDHGAWVPLLHLYPEASVPVAQLSIQPQLSPVHHYRVGEALRPLLEEGVLILASGSLTHNLSEFRGRADATPEPYVREFQEWMQRAIAAKDIGALLDYRRLAPYAIRAHPTAEHLLPLFGALGAAGTCAITARIADEIQYGILAMDAYVFQPLLRSAASVEQAGRPARELHPRGGA